MKHFLTYLQERLQTNWNSPALTDYCGGENYTLGQVAEHMKRLEVLMDEMGIKAGDKVALCGKNCANWGVAFFSLMASRRVAVSILPDFTPDAVQGLVAHSDATLFFASDYIWANLHADTMPALKAVISLDSFNLLYAKDDDVKAAHKHWNSTFQQKYPQGYSLQDVAYPVDNMDELALINYTSGTTSSPKGVMLSYRSISSNIQAAHDHLEIRPDDKYISILPLAHMIGLVLEFLYETTAGIHVYFLGATPTPSLLLKAFRDVRPFMMISVPLILEKIFRKGILPRLKQPALRILWNTPLVNKLIINKIRKTFINTLGGNIRYIFIGGAALNGEVEACMKKLDLPYVVAYGMTECGPLITFEDYPRFAATSCGKALERMEVRIDSSDPLHVPGEIQTRGENVMLGYYKNEEATRAAFTKDGWLHTGDLALFNKKGDVFIKGRSKSMLLGPSGQNIYPEEIEALINSLPGVNESVVVDRDTHLIALIYPEQADLEKLGRAGIEKLMAENMQVLNGKLPKYSQIHGYELQEKEFEKTPKKSIKRFMYK